MEEKKDKESLKRKTANHHLPLHSDAEENDKVEHEDRPEYRNVEDGEESQ